MKVYSFRNKSRVAIYIMLMLSLAILYGMVFSGKGGVIQFLLILILVIVSLIAFVKFVKSASVEIEEIIIDSETIKISNYNKKKLPIILPLGDVELELNNDTICFYRRNNHKLLGKALRKQIVNGVWEELSKSLA